MLDRTQLRDINASLSHHQALVRGRFRDITARFSDCLALDREHHRVITAISFHRQAPSRERFRNSSELSWLPRRLGVGASSVVQRSRCGLLVEGGIQATLGEVMVRPLVLMNLLRYFPEIE